MERFITLSRHINIEYQLCWIGIYTNIVSPKLQRVKLNPSRSQNQFHLTLVLHSLWLPVLGNSSINLVSQTAYIKSTTFSVL